MQRAYVGLGANLGERERTLRRAVDLLDAHPKVELRAVSAFRETAPVGREEQPDFVNAAAAVDSELGARALLDVLLGIEQELGRVRDGVRDGPRTVDLDLLVYGDLVVDEPGLTVPHPRVQERRFALEPLAELDPQLEIPGCGKVVELLSVVGD